MRFTLALLSCAAIACDAFTALPALKAYHFHSTSLAATPGDGSSRREAIQFGALALSSLLVPGSLPSPACAAEPKTIVLTGGNSGIGYEATKRLAAEGHTIILPCRTMKKSLDTVDSLSSLGGNLIAAECDLASIQSIKSFAKDLPSLLGGKKIDVLGLNAGLARDTSAKDCARTADGFELTVGTNHFGHFSLNKLLLPMMNGNDGKIVVTASGVHDPDSPGGAQGEKATLGDLLGLERDGKNCEMVDGQAFNADKAYKDSKLCNVLFTRELQKRLEGNPETKGIVTNCFNPGLIVSTGLFRDQNPLFTKVFDFAATDLFKVGESPPFGGGCLAYLTTLDSRGKYYTSPPGSGKYGDAAYGNQFALSNVSTEASDDAKAKRFWDLTESILAQV